MSYYAPSGYWAMFCSPAVWQMILDEEYRRRFKGWLETQRRLFLYSLQWGTPTGPYWAKGKVCFPV